MSYSRAHHWARGGVGQQAHRASPGAEQLESASARRSAADRLREREHERLYVVTLEAVVEREELETLARKFHVHPVDLAKRVWSLAEALTQAEQSLDAWWKKPGNVERMRAADDELAAAVQRAREACEGRR